MEGELAAVRGVVDLSPETALDEAEAFLTRLGYVPVQRTDTSLVAERRQPDRAEEQKTASLTVNAKPQMGGGVEIRVRGTDTCATLLLSRGVHPTYVQALLGHATIAITLDTYSHVLPSMGDATAKAMEDALA
jgi:hypothetical protein